tara:strand:- start:89 stop:1411 length:1323 start_codon:yes stop_codon:yes gene_type:complete
MTRARDLAAGTFELATGGVLKLETSDTTVTDGSVLGKIEFKAPDEASGTDANLTAAAIEAVAEGTFAADNNATELVFKTGASAAADAKMTLTSGGNLGIGTAAPLADFVVSNGGAAGIELQPEIATDTNRITNYDRAANAYMNFRLDALTHQFLTSGTERMRLDNSGNLLVGTTDTSLYNNTSGGGLAYRPSNELTVAAESSPQFIVNNTGSDGEMVRLAKDGSTVGSIITQSGNIILASGSVGVGVGGDNLYPTNGSGASTDNVMDVGDASARFNDAFITNGVTTGSDRTEKQDIAALTATEMLVAARLSKTFHTYRWKDAVADKGDDARIHTGTIAQEVQSAFIAEGLDAGDYAMFMSDTWWEHDVEVPAVEADEDNEIEAVDAYTRTDTYDTQSEAPAGATSKTRMGIRYPELLSFVAAYNEQRFASIETRLTALEG